MIEKIRRLGSETAIYGVSTIVGRFLTFLLTPFYANVLTPAELGLVATLFAYIAFLNVIYHYGMDTAYMKFVSTLELGGRKETFTVPFVSVALSSLVLSVVLWMNGGMIAEVSGIGSDEAGLITYSGWILLLDAVSYVPFAVLRMEHMAFRFAAIKVVGILVNVILAVLFLAEYDMGVPGIFLAGALSSGVTFLLLLPTIVGNISFSWPSHMFRALFAYGFPTLPSGLAAMMLQVIDRPILEALTDKATVGIYQANYRLGIFMMLVVSMFEFAWRPFLFVHAADPHAKPLFARVLTYLVLIMTALFLVLAFFLDPLVRSPFIFGYSVLPEAYWPGLSIVPIVLLAYLFLGVSTVFSAGLYIEKKTAKLPIVTMTGAAINVVANFLLIPVAGIHGAAAATLISYFVIALLMYLFAQRIYPVRYETPRMAKIAAAGLGVYLAGTSLSFMPPVPWRALLMVVFFALLYMLHFFEPSEIAGLRDLVRTAMPSAGREKDPAAESGPDDPSV